jgi:hypothetical protein
MGWQMFLQWLFIMAAAASIFGAFLAWASRKNGRETRELIRQTQELIRQTHERSLEVMERNHKETLDIIERTHRETMQVLGKLDETLHMIAEAVVRGG